MSILSFTPLADLLGVIAGIHGFAVIIFYGGLLTLGNAISETAIERKNYSTAVVGILMLMFAYGTFGAGLLKAFSLDFQILAVGVTAVITTVLALAAGVIVYRTDRDFSKWRWYSFGFFAGVVGFGALGFITPIGFVLAFISALLGFLALLVYEIWEMKAHHNGPLLNAVGLYVAYMGVFIQILQIVLRLLSKADE